MKDRIEIINEQDFEAMLVNEVSHIPPTESVVKLITPWKKCILYILIGLFLNLIIVPFHYLHFFLPLIGTMFLFAGFRSIKKENLWFQICYILSIIRMCFLLIIRIIDAYLWRASIYKQMNIDYQWIGVDTTYDIGSLLLIPLLFFLWVGYQTLYKKAGIHKFCVSVFILFIWGIIVTFIDSAIIQHNGRLKEFYIGFIFLISLIGICILIYRTAKTLDYIGYIITPAKIRFSNMLVFATIAVILLTGITIGYTKYNKYPMVWTELNITQTNDIEFIQGKLLELGFPEDILNDLTEEELLQCSGAVQVKINSDEYAQKIGSTKNLLFRDVFVELDNHEWVAIHHYKWTKNPDFCGTESTELLPLYGNPDSWESASNKVTGRLLYDKNDSTYTSPYHTFINYDSDSLVTSFSFPDDIENGRGYFLYKVKRLNLDHIGAYSVSYRHQEQPDYPVSEAKDDSYVLYSGTNAYSESQHYNNFIQED